MIKRIFKAILRRLKGQSSADVQKEWLLAHGLRIGEKVDCFSWSGMDFQYPGLITIGNEVTIASGCRLLAHDATPEEWAQLREKCAETYAYVTRREDV